jgi:UDP-N-acetyl-D-mannosaminuronic acid transferase (WecB/TagA/CpsF family)
MPVLAVGAAFDFHAGTLCQAPEALQRAGLEWAFRLCLEPRRLWRRYLFLNPCYLFLVSCQMAALINFDADRSPAPGEDLNYA